MKAWILGVSGAELAFDSSDPDWFTAVLDATGGAGVDVLIDQCLLRLCEVAGCARALP